MVQTTTSDRLVEKTPEASFLHVLQAEFNLSLREAREVVSAAQEHLGLDRATDQVRPGQVRLVVASLRAPFGPPLCETDRTTVTLTVDAGAEDAKVLAKEGRVGLRQGRILRLVDEALDQGGVLTEEDLARVLQVTLRTIIRDIQTLKTAGHVVQTRGQVKGTGRGQTHKVRIIELWLDRQGYDRIALWAHHSVQSIKRYIAAFQRVVTLHREGAAATQIAFLVSLSERLVGDYLALYERIQGEKERLAKLEEELVRVNGPVDLAKRGALRA
ncbi:DUF1670 domain-containing protein [Candidatus Amarolinea dominans]|jgi:hypothetical protein|uniref:DUF1670 domain-containing protein n=1 Tax=Candidatus Amarolinea dominans TaxID=3140696 RepID=UPI001D92EB47|nr:DUF1670 domain-containing protein [Anaerolineae bacterium]MBK9094025.1 DUF1670 domain-containing protein [Anaerolineae bacterium]